MKTRHVTALVLGCLLLLPGFGLLLGGGGLALSYGLGRDRAGYVTSGVERVTSSTAAVTAADLGLVTDRGTPDWLVRRLDAHLRLAVTATEADQPMFVGVGPAAEVAAYLAGVAHDRVSGDTGGTLDYRRVAGDANPADPTRQTFWVASASRSHSLHLDWAVTSGSWAVVLMNVDGSPGISADVAVGAKAGLVLPLSLGLLGLGAALIAGAALLLLAGIRGNTWQGTTDSAATGNPVALSATLDPYLSRWTWLVKWVLAVPHLIVLVFLWPAFVVMTAVAGFAILVTGRYPRSIFDFNVGVLRWSWRVAFYATTGGIGTEKYPPFSLSADPAYPATLDVAYPERLSRGLVLVKWWLLALPHYVVVAVLVGWPVGWFGGHTFELPGGGLLGLLMVVTGLVLLVSGTYPRALFTLVLGLNRWLYRVIAYAALMTDRYPPFRLDLGGTEPTPETTPPPPAPGEADVLVPDLLEMSR